METRRLSDNTRHHNTNSHSKLEPEYLGESNRKMASDPRRSRQQILLGPPHDDAMDEDDEDELFGESTIAIPQAVSNQLLNQFIIPSPFPHHTTGPTSSRFRNAFTRITTNPTSDVEAWQALMTEVVNCYRSIQTKIHMADAEVQLQLDWIESCYGTLLKYFPYSVAHVVAVAELLLAQSARVGEEQGPFVNVGLDLQRQANAQAKLEHLLSQYLGIQVDGTKDEQQNYGMCTHSVDLWMIYISNKIRQARRDNPGNDALVKEWATQAYELALQHAGFGFQNHVLWKAYLQYTKQATVGDTQHMVILRQLYQRLVCHPMTGLDQLWQEYELFERQQSEALAQALIGEFTPKYQHARTVYLERNRVFNVQDLQMDRMAAPPNEQELAEEYQVLQLWKTRCAYERTNPERLSTLDLQIRIRTCFKEMACAWTQHPEVWHMWSKWEETSHAIDRAIRVLEIAQVHIPDCTLLAHAQAQLVELHDPEPSKCLHVMETFLDRAPNTLGYALYQQMVRRYKGKEAARAVFSKARRVLLTPTASDTTSTNTSGNVAIKAEDGAPAGEGDDTTEIKKEDSSNGRRWMVTNRLDESIGKATPSMAVKEDLSDKNMTKTRPGPITWHLFSCHATIEHRLNHAPIVAARIYELGLRKHASFLTQPAYVLRYAHLLLELQDVVNLRALLTRALAACSDRKSPQVAALWDMALQFESLVSIADATNVPAAVALERKRRAALLGPDIEDVATGIRVGMGDSVAIGAQKSTIAEQLVRQDGYDVNSTIVNGMSRAVDVLDIMGLWGSGSGRSNPLGNTVSATQAVEDEEEIIPGGKSDAAYQKRQHFAKLLGSGGSTSVEEVVGGDPGSRLLSARERLQAGAAPSSQNTAVTMVIQSSPEWLRDLILLLPASRLRTPVLGKPPPHLTEMALSALRQSKLPAERPQDDKDTKASGTKHKLGSGNGGDSSDDEGGAGGSGGYGTQFRSRQRARQSQNPTTAGIAAEI